MMQVDWESVEPSAAHINLDEEKTSALISKFEKHIKPPFVDLTGMTVLDYGCGGGYFAEWVTKAYDDIEYIGYDISKRSVAEAKKRNPKLHFSNRLPKNRKINVVVCLAVIQHTSPEILEGIKNDFIDLDPELVIVQYRNGKGKYDPSQVYQRLFIPTFTLDGYDCIYTSEVEAGTNYQYKYLIKCH